MRHDQLESYINNFREGQREEIYKQIIDKELLKKAFDTAEGKAILGNCVDLIASNTLQIVKYCSESTAEDACHKVYPYAREINTVYKLMTEWAKTIIRGDQHTEKAEKL